MQLAEAHIFSCEVFPLEGQEGQFFSSTSKKCSDYYPFGKVMPYRSWKNANSTDDFKFTGHERDDEANLTLDYMLARNYDPEIGRFLQIDPLLEFASPFTYVGNNPIRLIDPTGMYSVATDEAVPNWEYESGSCPENDCEEEEKDDVGSKVEGGGVSIAGTAALGAGGINAEIGIGNINGQSYMLFTLAWAAGFDLSVEANAFTITNLNPSNPLSYTSQRGYGGAFNGSIGPVSYSRGGDHSNETGSFVNSYRVDKVGAAVSPTPVSASGTWGRTWVVPTIIIRTMLVPKF